MMASGSFDPGGFPVLILARSAGGRPVGSMRVPVMSMVACRRAKLVCREMGRDELLHLQEGAGRGAARLRLASARVGRKA